jgi:hypothetical protein
MLVVSRDRYENPSDHEAPFEERDRIQDYPSHLRGPSQNRHGGHQMCRMRGFRGAGFKYFGPGRVLDGEEKQRVIEELKVRGEID